MNWYTFVIEKSKWYVFTVFAVVFAWGAVLLLSDHNAKVPTLLFLGLLILWCIVWVIASYYYRKELEKRMEILYRLCVAYEKLTKIYNAPTNEKTINRRADLEQEITDLNNLLK